MTDAYLNAIYPGVLGATVILLVAGVASLVAIRAHRTLTWVVTGFYVVTLIEVVTVVGAVLGGGVPVVITVGYALASIALLPLLGIARLGTPEAAAGDPTRPVLQPDQIARVDGGAAVLVAIAGAVVAWRLAEILSGATA